MLPAHGMPRHRSHRLPVIPHCSPKKTSPLDIPTGSSSAGASSMNRSASDGFVLRGSLVCASKFCSSARGTPETLAAASGPAAACSTVAVFPSMFPTSWLETPAPIPEAAAFPSTGARGVSGVSGVPRALEQDFDAHTSEPRGTNPPASPLDHPQGVTQAQMGLFGLQCERTGLWCDRCQGIPCVNSLPLDGVNG